MSTPSQRFQTVITRIRPHRVAVLIDVNDLEWQRTCLRIIEYLSQVWGGSHSLLIPTDGNTIDDCFWELLSSFDADVFYHYQRTGHDLFQAKDPNFCEAVDQQMKEAAAQGFSQHEVERVRRTLLESPIHDGFSISDKLSSEIRRRLAPFDAEEFFQINYITAGAKPGYPLTYLGDLLPALPVIPDHITDIKNDAPLSISKPPVLWLLAECGIASEKYRNELQSDCHIQTVPKLLANTNEYELIGMGMEPGRYFNGNSPFALSRIGLKAVRSSAARMYQIPSVLVVGDTVKDFCLHYGLSRLHGRAAWVPSWFLPLDGSEGLRRLATLVQTLRERAHREHNTHFGVMSASCATDELQPIVDNIRRRVQMVSAAVENANDSRYVRKLVANPLIWYVSGAVEQITNQMVVDNQLPGTFESPTPSIFTQLNPQKHRWLVELTYWQRMTPRHAAPGRKMILGPNVGEVRAGSHGATYQCPGAFVTGEDMEFQVLRPSVVFPDAETIFRTALDYAGLECKVSDKGAYAQASIEKFGGLERIGTSLRNRSVFELLQKYRDKKRPPKGVYDEGVVLRDDRRYLNFACIQKILGDSSAAKRTLDEYIGKGILYRGFIFKCRKCADCSWFSVKELTQSFTCRRCGTRQQYVESSWNYPDEPSWFYKMDEIVYHMLEHDGHVSMLALDKLRRNSIRDFQFAPELQIRHKGAGAWEMEVDICCISAGQMQVGEAKCVESLASGSKTAIKVASRYRWLGEQLNASAVVFATTASSWDPSTNKAIETEFAKSPFLRLIRLGQDDLLRR